MTISPEDIKRKGASGYPLKLLDGNAWLIANIEPTSDPTLKALIDEVRAFLYQDGWQSGYAGETYIPGSYLIVQRALQVNYELPAMIGPQGLNLVDLPTLAVALLYAVGIKSDVRLIESIEEN